MCVISGFRRDLNEICALLIHKYCITQRRVVNPYRRFDTIIGSIFKGQEVQVEYQEDFSTLEDGTDRLSRNVGAELPLYAA